MKSLRIFSFLLATLLAVGTLGFIACSQDEAEDTPTKAELLKAKAAEFAKKYGVQMSLNEENIEQISETLTVEQMEQDFQAFANFQGATSTNKSYAPHRTKGLKIKRAKVLEEEADSLVHPNPFKIHEGKAEADVYHVEITKGLKTNYVDFHFVVTWCYTLNKANFLKIDITVPGTGFTLTHESTGYVSTSDTTGDQVVAHGIIKLATATYDWTFSYTFSHDCRLNKTSVQLS